MRDAGRGAVVGRRTVRADELPGLRPEERLRPSGAALEVDAAPQEQPGRRASGRAGGGGSARRTPCRSRASPRARRARAMRAGRAPAGAGANAASNAEGRRGSSRRSRSSATPSASARTTTSQTWPTIAARPGTSDEKEPGPDGRGDRDRDRAVEPAHAAVPPARPAARRRPRRARCCTCSSVSIASSFISGRTSCPEKRAHANRDVRRWRGAPRERDLRQHALEVLLRRLGRRARQPGRRQRPLHRGRTRRSRPAAGRAPTRRSSSVSASTSASASSGVARSGSRACATTPRGEPPGDAGDAGQRDDGEHRPESELAARSRRTRRSAPPLPAFPRGGVGGRRRGPTLPASARTKSVRSTIATMNVITRLHRALSLARGPVVPCTGRRTTPSRRRAPSRSPSRRRTG